MRGHAGYVRVDDEAPAQEPDYDPNAQRQDTPLTPPSRPRGRSRRISI